MASRKRVNPRRDKRIFRKTAGRGSVLNLPGHQNRRGGTCL